MAGLDVLAVHPELAPNVLQLLSDALRTSQHTAEDVQRRLTTEQASLNEAIASRDALSADVERLKAALAALEVQQEQTQLNPAESACCAENKAQITKLKTDLTAKQGEYDQQVRLNTDLSVTVQAMDGELRELRQSLEDRYIELRKKQDAVEEAQSAVAQQETALAKVKEEWAVKESAAEQSLKDLRARYEKVEEERNVLLARLRDKASRLETQEEALKTAIKEKETALQSLTEANEKLGDAETQRAANNSALGDLIEQMEGLRAEQRKVQQEFRVLVAARAASEKLLSDNAKEIRHLKEEKGRINEDLANLVGTSQNEIARLNGDLTAESARTAELQKKCDEYSDFNNRLQERVVQRNADLEAVGADNRLLSEENSGLTWTLHDAVERIKELEREEENNLQEASDLTDKCTLQKVAYVALEEVLHKRDSEMGTLREENTNLKASVLKAAAQVTEQRDAEMAALREENTNLKASVLKVGAQATQQLQQTADKEREELREVIRTHTQVNMQLQDDLETLQAKHEELVATERRLNARLAVVQPDKAVETLKVRELYGKFMAQFPVPMARPPNKELQPIDWASDNRFFTHTFPTQRRSAHFPKRVHWCPCGDVHAILYHPTHEYRASDDVWVTPPRITALSQVDFDLFVTDGACVYYAGLYRLRSMRAVHTPGSSIPADICAAAIQFATGLPNELAGKIGQCFPDGQIKVECFGLQCVGFDQRLYEALRHRFETKRQQFEVQKNNRKRPAGDEDTNRKAQKLRLM
ncbi:hypothetical protein C8R43DRAFT_1007192 [Mycena crocata]|nr:hypothetical protein C8R43DRAFT_1007192 [Mycena crocata]